MEMEETSILLHVTDSTGRDDWARVPRYGTYEHTSDNPYPDPYDYVRLVDLLDLIMFNFKCHGPS